VASGAEPIRALVLMRGAFQRTAEGPPETRLPRLAAAHRARGQLAANGDRIPTVGAAELPFCMIAGGSELDFVAVGGSRQAFTDWYAGSGSVGPTIGVIGWHTGTLGKLVFFIGLAVVALVALREAGIELPPTVPDSLVVIALGSLSTIFVMIRLISIPDEFLPAS